MAVSTSSALRAPSPQGEGMASFQPRISRLALALLVLGVLADDHDFTLALDDLALFAHGLHGRSHFHVLFLLVSSLSAR